jgi:hypothetical protein
MGIRLTEREREQIQELRADGHTIKATAELTGRCAVTIQRLAPGRPGKVSNDRLREAFVAQSMSAAAVAQAIGWGNKESSRVRRTLGLSADVNGNGIRSVRRMIDWETGSLIADAIGVEPWSVLDDDLEAAA